MIYTALNAAAFRLFNSRKRGNTRSDPNACGRRGKVAVGGVECVGCQLEHLLSERR